MTKKSTREREGWFEHVTQWGKRNNDDINSVGKV
jgi:hypothetical protein